MIRGLGLGSHHTYLVRAFNAVGEGAGRTVSVDIADVPSAPVIVSVKAGVRNVTLVWSLPSDDGGATIMEYVIYRAEGLGPFQIIAILSPAQFQYLDSGLAANVTYRYMVAAMNEMGTGHGSDVAQATALPDALPVEGGAVERNWMATYGGAIVGMSSVVIALAFIIGFLLLRASRTKRKDDKPGKRRRRR
jgi:hypothetical protein